MKVMAREGLPNCDPALLNSGKSALIDGLLMLLVCHAFIVRGRRIKDFAFRVPEVISCDGGLIPQFRVQYRSNYWILRLGTPLADRLRPPP